MLHVSAAQRREPEHDDRPRGPAPAVRQHRRRDRGAPRPGAAAVGHPPARSRGAVRGGRAGVGRAARRRLGLDPTSVYRNLETLERHGLVRHVHLGHGPGLYTLVGHGEHEYIYCDRCGAVTALPSKELDPIRKRIRERYGYEARFNHFPIVGTCAACSGAAEHEHLEHEHSHGDYVHSHPHAHREGLGGSA